MKRIVVKPFQYFWPGLRFSAASLFVSSHKGLRRNGIDVIGRKHKTFYAVWLGRREGVYIVRVLKWLPLRVVCETPSPLAVSDFVSERLLTCSSAYKPMLTTACLTACLSVDACLPVYLSASLFLYLSACQPVWVYVLLHLCVCATVRLGVVTSMERRKMFTLFLQLAIILRGDIGRNS